MFRHGLNSIERMQAIWDNIMLDRDIARWNEEEREYMESDQYWKDYIVDVLWDFQNFPEGYGLGDVA